MCVVGAGLVGQFKMCGMFVPIPNLHDSTQTCKQLRNRHKNEAAVANQASAESIRFYVNSSEIKRVTTFCYVGQLLVEDNNNTAYIRTQINKACACWRLLTRALKRDGADAYVMSHFYLAVVMVVLLYGADSWTISVQNMGALKHFHKRVVRHITGCHIR